MTSDGHVTEPNEFTALSKLEQDVYELRKTFEYTKDLEGKDDGKQ